MSDRKWKPTLTPKMHDANRMPAPDRKKIGERGEELAAAYLRKQGYLIEARNYRRRHAEIDIICRDTNPEGGGDPELVFVEVKTRTSGAYGDPADAVSPHKINLLRRTAEIYLFEKGIEDVLCRFDVVAIRLGKGKPVIEHLKDVIDY